MKKIKDLTQLTKAEKIVAGNVLDDMGYSDRKIEELLGLDRVTKWRNAKKATPDELKQFEADFIENINQMKQEALGLVQKRLKELIPKETKIESVINAAKYLENKPDQTVLTNYSPNEVAAKEVEQFVTDDEVPTEEIEEHEEDRL